MAKPKDIAGIKFNRLTPIEIVDCKYKGVYWACRCECGNSHIVEQRNIIGGSVKSCGCAKKRVAVTKISHPLYSRWKGMLQRCSDPNSIHYSMYGGRGISVCSRWLGADGFWNFVSDVGEKPFAGASIDRIDPNGNYEPSNCRWATPKEQGGNTRSNRLMTLDGVTKTMSDWSRDIGINLQTLSNRVSSGWSDSDALSNIPEKKQAKFYQYKGKGYSLSELSRLAGISIAAMHYRLKKISVEDAVELPISTLKGGKWSDGRVT